MSEADRADACAWCRWWNCKGDDRRQVVWGSNQHECRRGPPIVSRLTVVLDGQFRSPPNAEWPLTNDRQWCGGFERFAAPKEDNTHD